MYVINFTGLLEDISSLHFSSCHREQCRDPGAVICFTLMDYDVITANDFGGEAFLPLHAVSGVEMGSSSVDNFHGLKPHYLPLMFQKQKSMISN